MSDYEKTAAAIARLDESELTPCACCAELKDAIEAWLIVTGKAAWFGVSDDSFPATNLKDHMAIKDDVAETLRDLL